MPRIDNSNVKLLEELLTGHLLDGYVINEVSNNIRDLLTGTYEPGIYGPFDLCDACHADTDLEAEVEHPYYEDGDYFCCVCGERLGEDDN